jgi:hypothetical protein
MYTKRNSSTVGKIRNTQRYYEIYSLLQPLFTEARLLNPCASTALRILAAIRNLNRTSNFNEINEFLFPKFERQSSS